MPWVIRLSRRASSQVQALDGSRREELIRHMEALAESPAEFLRRSSASSEFPGLYVYTFTSEVVLGLVVSAYFDGFDDDPARLMLVAVVQQSSGDGGEE